MGAIAVSKETEQQIERLRKALGIPSKAGILRVALQTLEEENGKRAAPGGKFGNLFAIVRSPIRKKIRPYFLRVRRMRFPRSSCPMEIKRGPCVYY